MITFKLIQETSPDCPRENENLGTMACVHGRYNLGDDNAVNELSDIITSHSMYRDSFEEEYNLSNLLDLYKIGEKIGLFALCLPLYLYDHSGIRMSTSAFSCSWDSGQVGFIYVTKEQARNKFNVKRIGKKLVERINNILLSEVEKYDQFLTGDVYGFEVLDDNEDPIDSCWGFYGVNVENNGMLEHIDEKYHSLAKNAVVEYN
jgi:hypothetical protein